MTQFYNQTTNKTISFFKTSIDKGLNDNQIKSRKEIYGLNELKAKKKINPLIIFLNQFKSFIIYILLFAVVISLIAQEYVDSIVIVSILIFNAFFGFIQEYRAEKAITALKKLSALKARVIRNGKRIYIDTKEIVPGDILILEEGDKIAADARVIESVSLQTLESSLTGESTPVSKITAALKGHLALGDRKNIVYTGTAITKGRGKAVVVRTGMKTEIGKIAGMISEVETQMTPLQKKLESFGKWVGILTLLICLGIFITGIFKENILSLLLSGQFTEFVFQAKEWFLTAIALAVAAVPEGLPAIVTIALALGVRRMVKRNALVRKLPSVETLGETTVICSDKTGTLTKNEMTVTKIFTNLKESEISGEGYDISGKVTSENKPLNPKDSLIFKIGTLCNNASLEIKEGKGTITGDPTEAALLVSAEKAGINHKDLLTKWKRIKEDPFDSERKMMSIVSKDPRKNKSFVFTKGAPEKVLEKCDRYLVNNKIKHLDAKTKKIIIAKNEEFAKQALRVLGFAYKEYIPQRKHSLEEKLIFVGLQGMIDPPRPEVKESIQKCKQAGIRVIMVTGDHQNTAQAVANKIGIKGKSLKGEDLSKMTEHEIYRALDKVSIFARVNPSHKMIIVKLLQKKGEIVAMTGDGVNDAPALKKADIGVAMGIKGTDVSKESSDMILQDDNFTSIVNSVEEGRGIYENIQKFVNYLLSCNLAEVLVIFLALVLSLPLPMTAVMLLWLNLVTDGLPALALSVDTNSKNLMSRKPKRAEEGIMNKSMIFNITFVSILITIAVLGLFYWAIGAYQSLEPKLFLMKIQTIAFTGIIIMEFARIQAIRSESKIGMFSNKYLILAVLSSLILQIAVIYTPLNTYFGTTLLNIKDWTMIIGATIGVLIFNFLGIIIKNKTPWFEE